MTNKQMHKDLRLGNFLLEIGWFPGEELKLFALELFHVFTPKDIAIFSVQVAKFCISLFFYGDKEDFE